MRMRSHCAVNLLAVWLWVSMDSSAFGARLLSATVQLDGQTVLQTSYQDDDMWSAPPGAATVWRYLSKKPLSAEKVVQLEVDNSKPLQAKLQGTLVIRMQHVNRVIVEAKATELTLIRADPASDQWYLPVDEVERLAQANGIPGLPSATLFQFASTWLGLTAAAAVVVSLAAWLLLRARQRHPGEQVN